MKIKRFLSALLCAALMLTPLPATAQAHTINTDGTYDMANLSVASGGTISIGTGLAVTLTNDADMTYTNVQIVCEEGVSLTLNNVKIDNSAVSGACALSFIGAGNMLTLEDESTLISGENRHGVRVDDGTELNISGTGTLSATGGSFGAGIGGAGIGGGYGGGGIITINGGTVTATGGACGAGIGGGYGGSGGIITINGGTVTATGGYAGAGIGGGAGGSGGTVEITGGSVKASGSFGIQSTPTNGTANGNKPLSLAETALPLTDTQVFGLTIPGASYYGVNDLFTDAGGKLYLWLPAGATVSQARTADTIFNNVSGTLVADINIAAIPGVTAPVRGATPVTAITETAQYTGSVTWNPDHLAFAGGTVYTATITLTPKAGYTLTGVVKDFFTVAGADTVTNAAYSGVVTAVFPATEEEPPAEKSYDAEINVVDGSGTGSGWTFTPGDIRINENGSYLIYGGGVETSNRIRVKTGATVSVTLDNVNINVALPFEVAGTANVTIILKDGSVNTFRSGGGHAGIRVQPSATLTITTAGQSLGNGSLSAYGSADSSSSWATAGIGGSQLEASGTIVINGGIIFAKGGDGRTPGAWRGSGAAGIGGAHGGSCGDITINGGTVTAIGGNVNPEGAGIGGGSSDPSKYAGKITINGGTVRAYSGQAGANGTGIGFCSSIAITDTADVEAYSSGNYPAIYGTTSTSGHSAFLLSFMLDAAVSQDADIIITQTDDSTETFEMTLLAKYKNFAATVETANNYNAGLSDGSRKIVAVSDEAADFPGVNEAPSTVFSYYSAKLLSLPPLLQTAETSTDGAKVILTFDKAMASPAGEHGQFAVTADGNANTVTAAALGADGKTIELTLTTAMAYGQTVTASYTAGTVTSSDGGVLASFTDQAVTNNVPAPTYALTAPDSETQNGVTAAVTFSPASPVAAGTSVTATVTLTGTAAEAGTHTVDLTSVKAGLATDPKTETVTAGQNLATTPVTKTFTFTMPSKAVDDFVLSHTFSAAVTAPVLQSAATSTDGAKVILTFDKAMASPAGEHGQFAVTADGNANTVTAAALGADGKTIELTLTTAITYGQTVTASYTAGTVTSSDGGVLASFTDQAVTNNVPATEEEPPANNPPTAKSPVPAQSVTTGGSVTFSASGIAEDADGDLLTITGIVTGPDTTKATASLDSGTVTLTGVAAGNTSVVVTVSDGTDTVDVTVPVSVEAVVTYTITYDGNGGTGTAPTESDKTEGATFAAANNTFTAPGGKQFKEWNTESDGTGTSYPAGAPVTMPAGNLTLYAIWEDIPVVAPSINPVLVNFDLAAPADVFTLITWGSSAISVIDVVYGSESLRLDTDYTIASDKLTISQEYLSGLNLTEGDTLDFDITFDDNSVLTLTVNAVSNYTPVAPTWPAGSTLTASGTTRTRTTLSWTPAQDDVGVTAYRIFQDNSLVQTVTGTVYNCDVSGLSPSTTYTFKVQAGDAGGNWTDGPTVTVSTDSSGGGGSGSSDSGGDSGSSSSSSSSSTPATPTYKATVSGASIAETALPVRVNTNTGSATTELVTTLAKDIFAGTATALLTAPSISGVSAYTLGIPAASLSGAQGEGALTFATGAGSLTIPAGMLAGIPGTEGSSAGITIARGDKSGLPAEVQTAIGDRPTVQLTLTLDGTQTEWNNPNAPVTVSIPYTPTAAELANPESIVVWHIDGSGNVVSVPNGRYDPATGTVTFTTAYFNHYAVSYKQVSFKDVAKDAWYARAVSFIAARGITAGTGNGNFSPEAKLTRGQCIVMLMNAYGIAPDLNPKDNFADAGSTWYTGFLAAAKRLHISAGVGDNLFASEKEITRQEMFTLLHNALKVIGQLPRGDSGKTLSSFTDADDIAPWAKDAMKLLVETGTIGGSGGKLTPADTTTRAQMARVLHGLLGK